MTGRRPVSHLIPLPLALAGVLIAGCQGGTSVDDDLPPAPKDAHPSATQGADSTDGVSPLENPDGTKPGLGPVTADADRISARNLIENLRTKGRGPKTGYDRDEFGYAWMDSAKDVPLAGNGCDTRNDVLARDGKDLRYRSGSDCVLITMTLYDPYTAKTIKWSKEKDPAEVQIDHVVALSYSWQMGSSNWSESQRERVANDPLNLLPVEGRANSAKSDSGPASWLPTNKRVRCSYAVRFAQVSVKYDLPVTTADKSAMLKQCGG